MKYLFTKSNQVPTAFHLLRLTTIKEVTELPGSHPAVEGSSQSCYVHPLRGGKSV